MDKLYRQAGRWPASCSCRSLRWPTCCKVDLEEVRPPQQRSRKPTSPRSNQPQIARALFTTDTSLIFVPISNLGPIRESHICFPEQPRGFLVPSAAASRAQRPGLGRVGQSCSPDLRFPTTNFSHSRRLCVSVKHEQCVSCYNKL